MKTILILAIMMIPALTHARDGADQQAQARYAQDRQLCSEESTSAARMQCLRDAREEYNKALAGNKAESAQKPERKSGQACAACGTVVAVKVGEKEGEGSVVGVLGGGVVGAILGNQVGQGSGKDLATIAGAAGGAYAGHKIEQNVNKTKFWKVTVRFENGDEKSFNFDHDPGFIDGDAVRQSGNSIVRR